MNQSIVIVITFLVVITVGGGLFLFLQPSSPAPSGQGDVPAVTFPPDSNIPVSSDINSKSAVQAALRAAIAKGQNDNTKLYETVIAGGYALQVWSGDVMGGEALLKYDDIKGRWVIITSGGGSWSIHGLVEAGVPQNTAELLYEGVPH